MPPMFPKSILDVQFMYRTSNIYIGRPIYILNVRYLYPTSDIPALALTLALALDLAESGIVYQTSDIDIGRQI